MFLFFEYLRIFLVMDIYQYIKILVTTFKNQFLDSIEYNSQ